MSDQVVQTNCHGLLSLQNRQNANLSKFPCYYDAFVNIIKSALDPRILAMPLAFKNVGWLVGFVATAVIVLIMTCAIHILIRGMTELSRRHQLPYMSFEKAMLEGFLEGPKSLHRYRQLAEYFVLFFMLGFYFSVGSAYMVFMADGINKILEFYYSPIDSRLIICFDIIPVTLMFMIRNLKALCPFSMTANVLMFAAIFSILYFYVTDLPPLEERRAFNDLRDLSLFMGTVLFASNSLGVFLSIESHMTNASRYISPFGVLNSSMLTNCVTIEIFAFLGYWKYGDEVQGNVTLNISKDSILSRIITIAFIVATYISYALQCSVIVDILWVNGASSRYTPEKHLAYETLLRFTIVVATALIAICLPDFELILSLVGCVTVTILSICFPAILAMCLRYQSDYGPYQMYLWRDIFLILVGVAFCVLGIVGAFYH